jgi:hypothetical protein
MVFENREAISAPAADIPVIFRSLAFCRRQKCGILIFFIRCVCTNTH